MTPEEQRVAIAEARGWKLVMDDPLYEPYWEDPKGNMIGVSCGLKYPDYLNDLNAMHEAEKVLDLIKRCQFADNLFRVMVCEDGVSEFMKIHATASQRAEAFLKTLNLWKP
jgi:hypothetical protein